MVVSRVDMLMRFLTEDLALSGDELCAMRQKIDDRLRTDIVSREIRPKTLYLPSDPLKAL